MWDVNCNDSGQTSHKGKKHIRKTRKRPVCPRFSPVFPTGYTQVVDELQKNNVGNFAVVRSYTWGSQLISKLETGNSKQSFYGFDGHGSVRYLTDSTGTITDTYDYDAFGNLLVSTGSTVNNYLFAGEQWDPNLGLYYNRARYLDVRSGRFWSMDTEEGDDLDPVSLHKYLYAEVNPIDHVDPSGNEIDEIAAAEAIGAVLDALPQLNTQVAKQTSDALQLCCRPDVIDAMKKIWAESGNGLRGTEASFTVNGSLGNYSIEIQSYTNEPKHQHLTINPGITFAVFHVHPGGSGAKPSTPGNNAEGNPLGDTGIADKYKFDIYVVSSRGLWMYSWERKKDIQYRENLDWTKPCSEKPLLPPKWVNP